MTCHEKIVLSAILALLLILGIFGYVSTSDPPRKESAPVVVRGLGDTLECSDLLITPQGYLLVKTTDSRWALLSPTGSLLVWFNDAATTADLERQLSAQKTQKVFRQ